MSQEMFGSRGRGRGGGGGRGGGDRGGSRGFRGGGGRGFRGNSQRASRGSFRGGDRGGRGGDRGGRGSRGGPFGGGRGRGGDHGRGGPAFGNRGRGQVFGARGRGGAVLPGRREHQRYEIKAGLQLYITFNNVPNVEELEKLPGYHSVSKPYSEKEILRVILFKDVESLEEARKILDAHENVKSTDHMGMRSSKKQSDSLESRQVYLRFAKPYVEDDVKTLDSKVEEIIPLKENSCKVQFATAEEAEAGIERLRGQIGQNFLKFVDVPYVVQSAKLAVANIQHDQVVFRDVPKEVTIKDVAEKFPDAISFTLYNKTFPASKFCHAALRFKTNERAAEVLKMTDLKIAGKKLYVQPCCMELLHDYPNLGEPEPVEEEENGTQVKEEPPNKKRKVEDKKEVDEDADGEEESGEEEEDEDEEDEDEEEDENDEAADDDSDESD